VLGNTTPSTGEAAPRGVTVAEAFAQENPQHNARPGPRDKASHLPAAAQTTHTDPSRRSSTRWLPQQSQSCVDRHHPPARPTVLVQRRQHLTPHHPTSRRLSLAATAATRQIHWHAHQCKRCWGHCCPLAAATQRHRGARSGGRSPRRGLVDRTSRPQLAAPSFAPHRRTTMGSSSTGAPQLAPAARSRSTRPRSAKPNEVAETQPGKGEAGEATEQGGGGGGGAARAPPRPPPPRRASPTVATSRPAGQP
jgi:hypothetical protein